MDPDLRQVKVSTPEGLTTTFRTGQQIPLRIFGGGSLAVDDIFRRTHSTAPGETETPVVCTIVFRHVQSGDRRALGGMGQYIGKD